MYAVSVVFGLAEAFFFPAYIASVPQIVPAEDLPSANSLTSLSWQLSGVIGPTIGALLVAAGGTPLAFGLDSLSFLISAACLIPLRIIRPPMQLAELPHPTRSSPIGDLRDGWSDRPGVALAVGDHPGVRLHQRHRFRPAQHRPALPDP